MLTRQPIKSRPTGTQAGNVVTIPAPIGGWNARDPITALPPEDAVVLDNYIPASGGVRLRNGYTEHASNMTNPIETLFQYAAIDGSERLFAAAGSSIWDVTSGGSMGAASVTGLTNARWEQTMFATAGGNFLVICNGADSVRNYNGASWSTPSITGVSSANLIAPISFARRLFFIEENSLSLWYLATESISGAATEYDLGALCKKGGYLVAGATWTRDGGSGSDDYLVLATSQGQVVIFAGTDPSDANNWQMVGAFDIPEPIGKRCFIKTGADLGILTSQGLLPLSEILPLATSATYRVAATNKIKGAFNSAYISSGTKFGWQAVEWPKGGLLIVNVPILENASQVQYVMNTLTGSWCRFTGMEANCWSLLGDEIYFGGNNGRVYKITSEYLDDGNPIDGDILTSFQAYGTAGYKRFTAARPLFYAPREYTPAVEVKVDYDTSPATVSVPTLSSGGSIWDVALWDVGEWAPALVPTSSWQGVNGIGQVGALRIRTSVDAGITLNQIDMMYESGGYY